jgi:hypothetical protein
MSNIGIYPGFTPVQKNLPFPTLQGNSGKYLTNNGVSLSWVAPTSYMGGQLTVTTYMTGVPFNEAAATVASASTVNIGAAAGNYLTVTGSTQITAFDTVQAGSGRTLKFSGSPIMVNSANLILLGGQNVQAAPGDVAQFVSEGGGTWRMIAYSRVNGAALVAVNPTQSIAMAMAL